VNRIIKETPKCGFNEREEKRMEVLPKVKSLRGATQEIIKNNRELGYPPNRFIQMVSVKDQELPSVCARLVTSQEALTALYEAFLKYPNLLTLEDFIGNYGSEWGFTEEVINESKQRSELFDQFAKRQRYIIA
jgi:hypothetical protein